MIPKVIHYCWFGRNPLPPLAEKCIESWRKFLPDYEIKEWNEDNFDVNIIPYTAEAYAAKKYAFVSDYARFWILYHYGGVYFDTDVEIIKPLDDIIERGSFMGCERDAEDIGVNPGLGLGTSPKSELYKHLLDHYSQLHFDPSHIVLTIVDHTTNVLKGRGLQNIEGIQYIGDCYIYPSDYFNPIHNVTKRLHITNNTRSIHWYTASWNKSWKLTVKKLLRRYIPESILLFWNKRHKHKTSAFNHQKV